MQEFLIKNGVIVNDPGITANNLLVLDTNKKLKDTGIPFTEIATLSDLSDISAALKSEYNNLNYVVMLTGNQSISGHKIFKDRVEIDGDLIVSGNQLIVNSISISAKDNQIILNAGEVGSGVSAGYAGFRVDRGSLPYYDFQFRESDDNFVIGISGDYQAVATREDVPLHASFTYWDSLNNRLSTNTEFTTSSFISKTEVSSISSFINSRIDNISISAGNGLSVINYPDKNWLISITGSFGDASLRSEVGIVTGYLNNRLDSLYSVVYDISSTYINYQTVANLTGSLNNLIQNISSENYNQSLQITNISAVNISQSQDINRLKNDINYLASVTGNFAITSLVSSLTAQLTPLTTTASLTAQLQPFSLNLSAFSNYNTNGFIVQTATNTFVGRSISPGTGISIGNGNGVAGNPTISVNDYISRTDVVNISSALLSQITSSNSGSATYLNDLLDVNITSPVIGQTLYFDGTNWINKGSSLQGQVNCITGQQVYTITHSNVNPDYDIPTVSLVVPTSSSFLYVQGITNVTSGSFDVILSNTPDILGYKINWHINGSVSVDATIYNITGSNAVSSQSSSVSISSNILYDRYPVQTLIYNVSGQLAEIQTNIGNRSFSYNISGQLINISGNGLYNVSRNFTYDGNGNLINIS